MENNAYGNLYGGTGGILLQSQNIKGNIENKKKEIQSSEILLRVLDVAITIGFFLYLFRHPYVFSDSGKLFGLLLVYAIVSVPMIMLNVKLIKPVKEFYDEYIEYGTKEHLVVGEAGVYGSTKTEPFKLDYGEIESVTTKHNMDKIFQRSIDNEILYIYLRGKKLIFFSFANSRELAFMIEEQKNERVPPSTVEAMTPYTGDMTSTDGGQTEAVPPEKSTTILESQDLLKSLKYAISYTTDDGMIRYLQGLLPKLAEEDRKWLFRFLSMPSYMIRKEIKGYIGQS